MREIIFNLTTLRLFTKITQTLKYYINKEFCLKEDIICHSNFFKKYQ